MIIADTGGILALLDADDQHHEKVLANYEQQGDQWVLPWATLPEIDYLATKYLGAKVALSLHPMLRAALSALRDTTSRTSSAPSPFRGLIRG